MNPHPFFTLFENPDDWRVFASGQAEGTLSWVSSSVTSGLKLDYDFHGGGGFVVVRRVVPFSLPETFEIAFQLRGHGPPNHFEFKVADPGGKNVWRYSRLDFAMPGDWSDCRLHERDLAFAWGPAGGGAPSEVEAIEFVIVAGPGGKGSIELSSPFFEDQTFQYPRSVKASSHQPGYLPEAVFDTGSNVGWRADPDDAHPVWSVDFGRAVRFGGMVIGWPDGLPARGFTVEVSSDGKSWLVVHRGHAALGRSTHIATPAAEAGFLRIRFDGPECAAIQSLELRPDAFSSTPNEFIHAVAKDFPRGYFPRYWHREQSYWTPVGSPEGKRRALINEEGMVEVDEAGFSLEPVFLTPNGMITWAEVEARPTMGQGGLPFPGVTWNASGIELEVLPWVDGKGDNLTLQVSYRIKCSAPGMRLAVAVRPFQVNPPWQAFRNLGGRSPIRAIDIKPTGMRVEGRKLSASPRPDECGAAAFEEGGVYAFLAVAAQPPRQVVKDETGLASAVMIWALPDTGALMEVTVSIPYFGKTKKPSARGRATAMAGWRKTLGGVRWEVPATAVPAIDCFRTAAAHILINRDGPAIQPGPRRYTRSWVRDCVIMGAALAKAGLPHALREFITWYARFQREDGFVPCVVDRDGVDWLVEHDSHGQFLWGVREVFRNGGDREFLGGLFTHVTKAANYLITLRSQRMTSEYQGGGEGDGKRSVCYGLLPESASHEGYLAHPVHSYWDDFWGIRGLEAAADIAAAMGNDSDAGIWKAEAEAFGTDVMASLEKLIAEKQLNYIPGSVEWADFDPTATANAIGMLDFAGALPPGPLNAMLDTYLDGFRRRNGGQIPWNNYTAYEIRIIGAFVRLGRRDVANELLEFFLSDRRPREWNQWPEITWKDPRSPGHLGDVPHTWIAAEYILSLASMIASESETSDSLVLASGVPWAWISSGKGFAVKGLPTRYGALDFRIKAKGTKVIEVAVGGSLAMPSGGLTIVPPVPPGRKVASDGILRIRVDTLPFRHTIRLED